MQEDNSVFLDRLISNYRLASEHVADNNKLRSKEWLFINERNKKKFTNKVNIKNFRDYYIWLSEGMDTYGVRNDYKKDTTDNSMRKYFKNSFLNPNYLLSDHYNSNEKNLPDSSKYTFNIHNKKTTSAELKRLINICGESFILKNLIKKNIGNCPIAYKYKEVYYDLYNLCHLKYFYDLSNKIFQKDILPRNVIEIGGGFGVLADYLIKNFKLKYISIDLPEANLLTSWYLNQSQNNKKMFLVDDYLKEGSISKKLFNNYDIFILPPNIKIEDDVMIDLFINIRSMMEMDFSIVKKYFNLIHKHVSPNGYFYNINRYVSNRNLFNDKKRMAIGASDLSDYPYDENWEVIMSETSYKHFHMHTLITQRKTDNITKSIKSELKKIEKISKRFNQNSIFLRGLRLKNFLKKWTIFLILIFLRKFFSEKNEKKINENLRKIKNIFFKRS